MKRTLKKKRYSKKQYSRKKNTIKKNTRKKRYSRKNKKTLLRKKRRYSKKRLVGGTLENIDDETTNCETLRGFVHEHGGMEAIKNLNDNLIKSATVGEDLVKNNNELEAELKKLREREQQFINSETLFRDKEFELDELDDENKKLKLRIQTAEESIKKAKEDRQTAIDVTDNLRTQLKEALKANDGRRTEKVAAEAEAVKKAEEKAGAAQKEVDDMRKLNLLLEMEIEKMKDTLKDGITFPDDAYIEITGVRHTGRKGDKTMIIDAPNGDLVSVDIPKSARPGGSFNVRILKYTFKQLLKMAKEIYVKGKKQVAGEEENKGLNDEFLKEINKILNQIILKSKESIVNLEEEEVKREVRNQNMPVDPFSFEDEDDGKPSLEEELRELMIKE